MAFDSRNSAKDDWVRGLFVRRGLQPDASLQEVEPVFAGLWLRMRDRREATEMVIGHHLTSEAVERDRELARIPSLVNNTEEAFAALLMCRMLEEMQDAEQQSEQDQE